MTDDGDWRTTFRPDIPSAARIYDYLLGGKDNYPADRAVAESMIYANKLWRLAYRFDGKQKLLALGTYPAVSLADVRTKRDEAKRLLAAGIDPSVQRKSDRRTAKLSRQNTFAAIADELMEKFEKEGDARATLKRSDGFLSSQLLSSVRVR